MYSYGNDFISMEYIHSKSQMAFSMYYMLRECCGTLGTDHECFNVVSNSTISYTGGDIQC